MGASETAASLELVAVFSLDGVEFLGPSPPSPSDDGGSSGGGRGGESCLASHEPAPAKPKRGYNSGGMGLAYESFK